MATEQAQRQWGTVLGVAATLLIYDLARRLLGPRAAGPAALVWLSTQFLVEQFRIATADPYLAFFTLLAVWSAIARRPIVVYVALGLGIVAKGPVVFLTALPALIAYRLLTPSPDGVATTPASPLSRWAGRGDAGVAATKQAVGIALLLLIALPWFAYVFRHVPHALALWRYESIGEISDNEEKARPWWLYLGSTFRLPLPWTPLWIAGIALAIVHGKRGLRSRRGRRRLVPIIWYVSNLLFFSLLNVKKDAYLLPALCAMILTIADATTIVLSWGRRTRFRDLPGVLATTQAAIGIGAAAVVLVLLARMQEHRYMGIIAGSAALLGSFYALWPIAQAKPMRWLTAQALGYALILIALLGFQRPGADNTRSPRQFCAQVAGLMRETELPILVGKLPEEAAFYLPLNLTDGKEATRTLAIVDDNRLEIERGKRTADAAFFQSWVDDANLIGVRRIPIPQTGAGRWKVYELIIEQSKVAACGIRRRWS